MNKELENLKFKIYSTIKTPNDLSRYMQENIEYKWMDQDGNLHDKITSDMYTTYSMMSPQEVIYHSAGICVDQVGLERDWFSLQKYYYEVLCIQIFREDSAPGHSFLIYCDDNKWYWFENAWYTYCGIHCYDSRDSLISDIRSKFIDQNNILDSELEKLTIRPFPMYPIHSSYEQMDQFDLEKRK